MAVVVDGVEYVPASAGGSTIAVAVTTHNRPDVLAKALKQHLKFLPAGAVLIVVDDGSTTPATVPDGVRLVRNEKPRGVAGAKNRALDALSKTGADDWFIFDDDAWPMVEDWWRPYVESPEPHLMAIYDRPVGVTKRQVEVLYEDDRHVHYHATRGYCLYVRREVVETVGGMDPAFGRWGWEHMSWSDRIHAAGFTTSRYMDVRGGDELIYSMDRQGEIKSTATDDAKRFSQGPGLELRMESRDSPRYIEYRELGDVVLTTVLTAQGDPQRGQKFSNDPAVIRDLAKSVEGRLVCLTTGFTKDPDGVEVVKVSQSIQPYFERWVQVFNYLRDHPEVGRVWCVDAGDVTVNRNPFPEMESGVLYFGYEPETLRSKWMLDNHPDKTVHDFMVKNPNLPLLNMGVVGGDREMVMRFAQRMCKMWFDDHVDHIFGWETKRLGVGDMAAGNYVARTEFADVLSSGPHVTQVFKSKIGSTNPWFIHKAL